MKTRSLDALPDELLLEIVHFVGEQLHIPRSFRVVYNLSIVNHRLRQFAFHLVVQSLVFPTVSRFIHAAHFWAGDQPGRREHAGLVRNIRIASHDKNRVIFAEKLLHGSGSNSDIPNPFWNLSTFECFDSHANLRVFNYLQNSPNIRSLALMCIGAAQPVHHLDTFPELRTLRLYFLRESIPPLSGSRTLTTLVLDGAQNCDWSVGIMNTSVALVMFPNLRVFRLETVWADQHQVFDFVQRHATLMEVSVSMSELTLPFRLEALGMLIKGTGTWYEFGRPDDEIDGEANEGWDNPCEENKGADGSPLLNPVFPYSYIRFNSFSFSRVPITPTATKWKSSRGSKQPRYRATALSFRTFEIGRWTPLNLPVADIPDVLLLSDYFPSVEELRISSDALHWDDDFTSTMERIGDYLEDWKHLHKLAFSWRIPEEWGWDGTDAPLFSPLDLVVPPTEQEPPFDSDHEVASMGWIGRGHSIDDLRQLGVYRDGEIEDLTQNLRALHGGDDIDDRDTGLHMRTWQACHEPLVAKMMRYLAECCPTLEEIEWYLRGRDSFEETTRWRWKVHRRLDGKVNLVSGNLTWLGCENDPLPKMHILVGQELAYERDALKQRW